MTPFSFLSLAQQQRLFRPLVILTILLFIVSNQITASLRNELAPQGIVSFELAGTAAPAVVNSWDAFARADAAFSLGFDYLFILFWVSSTALGCLLASRRLGRWGTAVVWLGRALAWAQIVGGILDMIENGALFQLLQGGLAHWGGIAQACASAKFILLALGLLYALAGWALGQSSPTPAP